MIRTNALRSLVVLMGAFAGFLLATRAPVFASNPIIYKCDADCSSATTSCCADKYSNLADCKLCCGYMWGGFPAGGCDIDGQKTTSCNNACNSQHG